MTDIGLDFQLFFEESPDVLLVLLPDSPRFTVVAATKARLNSTHSTLEQTVGRGLLELFPDNPHDPADNATGTGTLRASLDRVLASKAPDTMAVRKHAIALPAGGFEVKYWSFRNIPILSPSGEVSYILHRADVTDLARPFTEDSECEPVRRSREFDVANRMAELELTNRELDAFSRSIAHDLRGPLRSIDGFSQMLLQEHAEQLNDEGRRRLGIVRTSAQRMSQLIDDLLRLAHMSRGEVRRIPFELSCLVRTVAMQLQEGKRERPVVLTIQDGVNVNADPHLMQIVLENLLGNAWKFTAKRADAEVEFGSQDMGGEVCYYVRDNGVGFDMNYSSKLFGVFQRLHPESEFHGTGVGLTMVKRIVGRHGGRVWAVGDVGRGATFYFTLGATDMPRSLTDSLAVSQFDTAG